MKFYSLNKKAPDVDFAYAAVHGQAPDKGLYFPEKIPVLPNGFIDKIGELSKTEIGVTVMRPYTEGSIPDDILKQIVSETIDFDFPLVKI
ncbi:MAG: threonine synthase, partial [Pseudopedobacter saltans]